MKWNNYNSLESTKLIKEAEKFFLINFPESYKKLVFKYDSGEPENNIFNTKETDGEVFSKLLSLKRSSKDNIYKANEILENRVPKGIIAFGFDPGGNYLCFDYRSNNTEPEIVFWNHEIPIKQLQKDEDINEIDLYEILSVAQTFKHFLKNLTKSQTQFTDDELDEAEIIDPDAY